MEKPTIFFSHSSKDQEIILPLKNELEDITSGVMDIFMSSDGQSIPFGRNWVHKIEEGLNNAKIMFVFITENSINTAWIYFEAGYAYSKNVRVIPVGIGVDIGCLKAPLNLLQGFNITVDESLNNFITIINDEFNLKYKGTMSKGLINNILSCGGNTYFQISDLFDYAKFEICSQYYSGKEIIRYDLDKCFAGVIEYLDENKISYSINRNTLLVLGIKMKLKGAEQEPKVYQDRVIANQEHCLVINISSYNYADNYDLLVKLLKKTKIISISYLWLYFNSKYAAIKDELKMSSIINDNQNIFVHDKNTVGSFKYKDTIDFRFISESKNNKDYYPVFSVFENIDPNNIVDLVNELYKLGIIYEV